MLIRLLPLVTGLLPVAAIHISYLLAIQAGRLPVCVPYIAGCTSISATGRYPPASYLFKAVMLPEAMLLVGFWLASAAWLRALERAGGDNGRGGSIIASLGTGGALCLVLYVTFLGTHEAFYEFMRRFGVYFYFLLSILAQIALAWKVRDLATRQNMARLRSLAQWQLLLCAVPFLLGALNLVLKATLAEPDRAENIIEWIFALLMQAYFVLAWAAWRQTGFSLSGELQAAAHRPPGRSSGAGA